MITSDLPLFPSFPLLYLPPCESRKAKKSGEREVVQIDGEMSSYAGGGGGGGGGEEQLFFLAQSDESQHNIGEGGFFYHVPQHSRREKLRFLPTAQDTAAPSSSSSSSSLAMLYQASGNLLPSPYYSVLNAEGQQMQGQAQAQGGFFSLSLSPAEASSSPLGPFTGYAAVLNRSGFVEPARQLLEEICQFARGDFAASRGDPPDALTLDGHPDKLAATDHQHWNKINLLSMLHEVYTKYRLYQQQVDTITASFETVAGLNTAAPFVSMALKSMCRNFRSIKNIISNHLIHLDRDSGKGLCKTEISGFGLISSSADQASSQRRNYGTITFGQPHVWRPQRGLPERAVVVLRAWLFEHFLHPYPTDTDKQMLAKQTGLTRNQVSNWFINARVRLWKPMVEEIHNLELHQSQKSVAADNNNNNNNNVQNTDLRSLQPSTSAAATSSSNRPPENNICIQRNYNQNRGYKSSNMDLPHIEEPYNFAFNDFGQAIGGNSVVSLTLGLHQNNATVCLPEPLSMNVARRYALEECNNAYVLGGHLLHDFVG